MPEPSQTFLAFDFGMKRIGVAVGQNTTYTASALPTLPAKQGQPDWSSVQSLINTWKPQALVVGIPLNMDDSEQFTTHAARKFANRLHGRFGLTVYSVDERLTTKEARAKIFEEGGYKLLKKVDIDSYAAKLILESWFHEQNRERMQPNE